MHRNPLKKVKIPLFWIGVIATLVVFVTSPAKSQVTPFSKKDNKRYEGIYPNYPKIDYGQGDEAKLVQKGEYLVKAGDCIACHTNVKGGGKPFAGQYPLVSPFGTFYPPNITPDEETGIGKWTFKDFKRAMREGKRPNGANLYPAFPFLYFTRLSDQDLRAIWAYLRKIPAVSAKNKPNDLPFPFNIRFGVYGWKILFFYFHKGPYQYDPKQSAQWNRGKYLVDGLGHCSMCHTPTNFIGGPKRKYYLTGAFIGGFWAPNITKKGLADTSVKKIEEVFQENVLIHEAGPVAGPMAEVNHNSLRYLTHKDQHAIATYLKTVESVEPLGVKYAENQRTLGRGKKVYVSACKICHEEGTAGAPVIGDKNNWFMRAKQGIPVLYRRAVNGYNNMPVKGGCVTCSDDDVESAVDYLLHESLTRQQWRDLKNPRTPPKQPTLAEGKEIYNTVCSACHEKGQLGAPIVGDKKAWEPILKQNFDALVTQVIKGGNKMPPKGGCKYCSTAELIQAVKYMVEQSKTHGDYSLW